MKSHTEGPKQYLIPVPPSNIGKQFGQLLESKDSTDVSFEVDGEVFTAHKVILAARSPVFRAQLFGPMREKKMDCIQVEDIEASVFKVHYSLSTPHSFGNLVCIEFAFLGGVLALCWVFSSVTFSYMYDVSSI